MKRAKYANRNENNDRHYLGSRDIQELILQIYKIYRSQQRMFQTMRLFAREIGKAKEFEQAFFATFRREKEQLKHIIEKQLDYLYEIGSPPDIIAVKQQKKDVAVEVVENVNNLGPEKVLNLELKRIEKIFQKSLFDITTNFAGDTKFPFNLAQDDDLDEEWKYDLLRT